MAGKFVAISAKVYNPIFSGYWIAQNNTISAQSVVQPAVRRRAARGFLANNARRRRR